MSARTAGVALLMAALLTGLGWSGEGWAEATVARVGILSGFGGSQTNERFMEWSEPFRRRLADEGWIEGKSISFEYRGAVIGGSQVDEAAAELARLKVDVIWATDAPAVRAAYTATRTIPIVAADATTDPVAEGYVQSYTRPGGNLTGVFLDAPEFAGKWLQFLKAIIPKLSRATVLWDPSPGPTHLHALQRAARSFGVQLQVVEVREPDDIDRAFSAFRGKPQALIILPSPMMYVQSERLAKLTMRHRLPATSMFRLFAEAGGVIAYGHEMASMTERCAVLVAKILGGAKPADIPVERPSAFQLVVNLKAAKALGLTVPESVLYRADEVIR
ncbi:MAG TPA: ABC transporter substrate-binding protein [Burkholderiales bacterium]|nr:ABC transporter substrate-binding protein [Burkholderiales bacterium]